MYKMFYIILLFSTSVFAADKYIGVQGPVPLDHNGVLHLEQSINSGNCTGLFCDSCKDSQEICSHHETHSADLLTFTVVVPPKHASLSSGSLYVGGPDGSWLKVPAATVGATTAKIQIPMSQLCEQSNDSTCRESFTGIVAIGWEPNPSIGAPTEELDIDFSYRYINH